MNNSEQKAQAGRLLENNSAYSLATRLLQAEREKCIAEQEYMRMCHQCDQGAAKIKELEESLNKALLEAENSSRQAKLFNDELLRVKKLSTIIYPCDKSGNIAKEVTLFTPEGEITFYRHEKATD